MTNKTPAGTYRGPPVRGRFLSVSVCSTWWRRIWVSTVEFRRRNLITENEMPWPLATVMLFDQKRTDNGDYQRAA